MPNSIPLTEDKAAILAALNKAVDDAIEARTKWLDEAMPTHATVKPGEELWDLSRMRPLGVVTGLYRFQATAGSALYDRSLDIEYKFREAGNFGMCIGNTSGASLYHVGPRQEAQKHFAAMAERLQHA